MASTSETLTQHLQSLSTPTPYTAATEHPFLVAAGSGKLSKELLSLYLAQDRLYAAHAYPRFIGNLVASVPFSSLHALKSKEERDNQHLVRVLSYSLQNSVRESNYFFVQVAEKFGLQLDGWRERKETRDYMDSMAATATWGSLTEGLVFLWAMERVYLDAWTHVRSVLAKSKEEGPASPAIRTLVDNWTNDEFVKFVDDLGDLVNKQNVRPGSEEWLQGERVWARVLELEQAFWPKESDVALLKL
ncbi:hypothetical protein NM688_g7008 [Phlebia brevispora]|uniref:Uncharacterized protein n=1 Tax=Phlebia brevispora TaxID=194682 RepID=A0ACC1S9Y5_9APHY|nr:hypothetical protein NM688_g7008 [Phlebia brevispora]